MHTHSVIERIRARRELKAEYQSVEDRELKWLAGNAAGYSDSRMAFHKAMAENPVRAIAKASVPWIGVAFYVSAVAGGLYLVLRALGLDK